MKYRYLLGDSRREAARLRLQARLWDPVSLALFDRLRIRPGLRVLEVGPGEGSLHRELRRRVGRPCRCGRALGGLLPQAQTSLGPGRPRPRTDLRERSPGRAPSAPTLRPRVRALGVPVPPRAGGARPQARALSQAGRADRAPGLSPRDLGPRAAASRVGRLPGRGPRFLRHPGRRCQRGRPPARDLPEGRPPRRRDRPHREVRRPGLSRSGGGSRRTS